MGGLDASKAKGLVANLQTTLLNIMWDLMCLLSGLAQGTDTRSMNTQSPKQKKKIYLKTI
jgi:hypothetical protein